VSKRSEAIEAARVLDSQGCDFNMIVSMLVKKLGVQREAARGIAAQVCKPAPRKRRGQIYVRHPSVN
jgi:hypothetical protein